MLSAWACSHGGGAHGGTRPVPCLAPKLVRAAPGPGARHAYARRRCEQCLRVLRRGAGRGRVLRPGPGHGAVAGGRCCQAGCAIGPGCPVWSARGARGAGDGPEQPCHSRGEPGRLLGGALDLTRALRTLYLVHPVGVIGHHARHPAGISGCPWSAQRPLRRPGSRRAPGTRGAHEQPRAAGMPGAAELAGAPCISRMGPDVPGPFRDDGLGNHRMHDIPLGYGPPCSGAVVTLSSGGLTVSRRRTHRRLPAVWVPAFG
jgi:hypothetical protein